MKKKLLFTVTVLVMSLCILVSGTVIAKRADNKKTVLKLSKADMCLYVGQVRKLDYSLSGNKKHKERVQWKSSDKKVATVNKKGEIKGKKTGKAKITIWIKGDSSTKAGCKVRVKKFKEMNYSTPFNQVKYIDTMKLIELKGDSINDVYFKVIESHKELKEFLNKYDLKTELDDKGYSFDDIDFSESSILVYERGIPLAQNIINKIDYSLKKSRNNVELCVNVEKIEEIGVYYLHTENICLIFEIMPKTFVESINKVVHSVHTILLNDNVL